MEESQETKVNEKRKVKFNLIELRQPKNKVDYIITDLEPEVAIEWMDGKVITPYGETDGRVCPVVLKFLRRWHNYRKVGDTSFVYALLSNPYLARKNIRVDAVINSLSEEDTDITVRTFDKSVAVEIESELALEKQLRKQAEEERKKGIASVKYVASDMTEDLYQMKSMALKELELQYNQSKELSFKGIWRWLKLDYHWVYLLIGFGALIFFLYTYFNGGG